MPVGAESHAPTAAVWPSKGLPTGCPVGAAHKRTVRSSLAEARRVPSGLKATLTTALRGLEELAPLAAPSCAPISAPSGPR